MREAILVLGMHRSGTSALAGTISLLGAGLPTTLMQANWGNAKGYFESPAFMLLHDRMLEAAGSSWNDWRPFDPQRYADHTAHFAAEARLLLEREFGDAPLFVLKDPRVCRFVPFWLSVLKDMDIAPRVVIPFRPPIEVARSLHSRERMAVEVGLLLWLRHVIDAERDTRAVPRTFLSMDELIDNWRKCARRMAADLGIVWPHFDDASASKIDEFLTRDLQHHEVGNVEMGPARSWFVRAYEAMVVFTRNPSSKFACATFDEIGESFEQAGVLMNPVFEALERKVTTLEAEKAVAAGRDGAAADPGVQTSSAVPAPPATNVEPALSELVVDAASPALEQLRTLREQTGELRRSFERLRGALPQPVAAP